MLGEGLPPSLMQRLKQLSVEPANVLLTNKKKKQKTKCYHCTSINSTKMRCYDTGWTRIMSTMLKWHLVPVVFSACNNLMFTYSRTLAGANGREWHLSLCIWIVNTRIMEHHLASASLDWDHYLSFSHSIWLWIGVIEIGLYVTWHVLRTVIYNGACDVEEGSCFLCHCNLCCRFRSASYPPGDIDCCLYRMSYDARSNNRFALWRVTYRVIAHYSVLVCVAVHAWLCMINGSNVSDTYVNPSILWALWRLACEQLRIIPNLCLVVGLPADQSRTFLRSTVFNFKPESQTCTQPMAQHFVGHVAGDVIRSTPWVDWSTISPVNCARHILFYYLIFISQLVQTTKPVKSLQKPQ